MLDKFIIYLIKGLVIGLPLFFLPWTFSLIGMDDFNKQYLLWLIVPLAVFLWIIKSIWQKEFRIKRTPLDIPIIIFLAVVGLATIFSLDKFSSFFGYYGSISQPYLGLGSLVLLYFFIVNFVSKEKIFSFVKLIMVSYGLIVLTILLLFLGFISPNGILAEYLKWAVGSPEDAAVFMAVINVLLFGLLINKEHVSLIFSKRWTIWLAKIGLILSLLLLILINFVPAWWCLLLGILLVSVINYFFLSKAELAESGRGEKFGKIFKFRKLGWSLLLVLLAVNFLLNNYLSDNKALSQNRLAKKLQLDYSNSLTIAGQAVRERPLLGYGPETFPYVFSLLRNPELNSSGFWHLRFNKSASYVLDLLVTVGILGFLSYLLVIASLFYGFIIFWRFLARNIYKLGKARYSQLVLLISLFAVLLSLVIGQFIYSANTVLLFLFWLIAALVMVSWRNLLDGVESKPDRLVFRELRFSQLKNSFIFKLVISVVFIFFSSWLILVGYTVKYWVAEAYFKNGLGQEQGLIKAAGLNPDRFKYQISLAKFYLEKAITELTKPEGKKDLALIQDYVNSSISWSKTAIRTAPYSVVVYETLGIIYRNLGSFSQGSEILVSQAFAQASQLEPSNPVLVTELGKSYFNSGQTEKAIASLEQALDLKSDYYEASFALAKAYIRQGREEQALEILEEITGRYNDAAVYYEQGRIYYNQKEFEPAINKFRQVISISPGHANALYSLGLALKEVGEKEEALLYFKKVLELNPGNTEVKERIEELEKEK